MSEPSDPVRGADGRWQCNTVAGCTNPAVIQWGVAAPTDEDPDRTVPAYACADHLPA